MSAQRVLVFVSLAWLDGATLIDWIRRLPRGSEVLYRPAEAGDEDFQAAIRAAGAVPVPIGGDPTELPRDERLDAVLIFAAGPALADELPLLLDAWKRGCRASLIPPATRPPRADRRAFAAGES